MTDWSSSSRAWRSGKSYTINVPMPAGMGDSEVVRIYRETVGALGREFAPDLVLVSVGFDAHRSDPLGDMQLTASGYAAVAQQILGVARSCCGGKVVFCLEGGYDLAGLEASIISVLEILSGQRRESDRLAPADSAAEQLIHAVHRAYGRYWPCLGAWV